MGCEGIRTALVQGPVHHAIDALVNTDATTREAFLNALKALQPADRDHTEAYLAILARYAPTLAENIGGSAYNYRYNYSYLDYLHDAWYNPSGPLKPRASRLENVDGFWPAAYHPTEPLIRIGLIKSIELAIEVHLPLSSYWLAAGDKFETIVIRGPQQVTRLIMTPPSPPPRHPERLWNAADIWVVKHGAPEVWEDLQEQSNSVMTTKLKMM